MNCLRVRIFLTCWLLGVAVTNADVRYVDINSASPTPPYLSWSTAATNIQDAVDAAAAGDRILVTNGVYETGNRVVFSDETNRVVVDKALDVVSVNGPQFTVINGSGLMRCVYLTNGASLSGFSLTNGATTGTGGGVRGAAQSVSVSNCVLSGNSAGSGGGASRVTLTRCTIAGNSAANGGGVRDAILNACTVISNSAVLYGGGVYGQQLVPTALTNCLLIGNSALYGGGAYGASTALACTLVNCTVVSNSAPGFQNFVTGDHGGGGTDRCRVINSIVYYNDGAGSENDNIHRSSIASGCTTAPSLSGGGNVNVGGSTITNAPLFVDPTNGNFRLQLNSPCINAGNNDYVTNPVDIEGKERIVGGTVDMGAYEWVAMPTHYVSLNSPNPTPPYLSWSTAATSIQDAVDAARGGSYQVMVTNGVYNRVHASSPFGRMLLQSVNGPAVTVIEGNGERCVYLRAFDVLSGFTLANGRAHFGPNPPNPHANEGGGAYCQPSTVISNCVLVNNHAVYGGGVYGGTLVRCTLSRNTATLEGAAAHTSTLRDCTIATNVIYPGGFQGGGSYGGALSNCTLIGNSAPSGGGAYSSSLINCRLIGNAATYGSGGGAAFSALTNCALTGNVTWDYGGAAYNSILNNCTVAGNRTDYGRGSGGVDYCTLNNSIVYYNIGYSDTTAIQHNYVVSTFSNSCTYPLIISGSGSITNAPQFVNTNGWINLRLQSNSPCINAGSNASVVGSVDLDGRPRIVGGTVDMGAYEFQTGVNGEFIGWLSQFGLPTDGSADYADGDTDYANNWQEWNAGTVPTNALSALRLLTPMPGVSGTIVSWQSVSNRTYFLERATDLGAQPFFSLLTNNIIGQPGTTSYTDTNASSPFFYRVGVQP